MKNFLKKPQVKSVVLGTLTILTGITSPPYDKFDITRLELFFFIVLSYLSLLIFYSTSEINDRRILKVRANQIEAFEQAMSGIISICATNANDVNATIHTIIKEGKINLNTWSIERACMSVCGAIYNFLCKLHGKSKDFGVSYVRLVETESLEASTVIEMIAFANQNTHSPTIYRKKRNINDINSYYDADLFKLSKSDIVALVDNEAIRETFSFFDMDKESRRKNRDKYSQYIAIPVFDVKMIGLLEIVCLHDTKLAKTEKELEEIASKYVVPYSFLILIMHKLEEALLAVPKTTS